METNRIKYSIIQQYLEGKLDPRAMHELEKQALEDPFLAEALEGYSETEVHAGPHLSLLQRQLDERIAQQQENKNTFFFTWQRLSIAAAAGLMFISAGILFWMKGDNRETRVAKHVEVKLTPVDSLYNEPEANDMASLQKREPVTLESSPIEKNRPLLKKRSLVPPESVTLSAKPADSRVASVQTEADTNRLNELVVVGYGIQKKTALTGAVSSVDSSPRIMIRGVSSRRTDKSAGVASISLADNKTILGKVVSKEDGSPLPGVSVRLEGSSKGVTTNAGGEFALADSVGGKISFAHLGYNMQVKEAHPGQMLTVEMEPQNSSLSEVVVVGYGSVKKQGKPVPVIGWKKYNEYLKTSVKSVNPAVGTLKGKVTVRFVVGEGGILSDFRIEKGLNDAYNNEAIRVIKEGPSWTPVSADTEVQITVKF